MFDKEQARMDPSSVFKHPDEILSERSLTQEEKIDILQRWAYDEREMSVAEEENMPDLTKKTKSMLDEVNKCLLELGVRSDDSGHPPTKQG